MSDNKYKLVIVESPAKAQTIEKYLGAGYKVVASKGHIQDLPKKAFGVDLDTFECEVVTIDGKADTIKEIQNLAKNASEIFLASDPDREGEAIAFHLRDIVKRKDAHRVLFNAITKSAILQAIQNPLKLDDKKYEAQQTRRILDRIVGYKISPILWKKLQAGLSAGRVQSVALRLVVEREEEILNFVPEKTYQLTAYLEKDGQVFESKYYGDNIKKKISLDDEVKAKAIVEAIKNQEFKVVDIFNREKKQNPTAPFTTSKLQQEAAYKLGFNSKKTMQIAQKLYEGITLKQHGRQGLITYMRTDSVRSEPAAIDSARKFIEDKYGANYVPKDVIIHSKKKSDSKTQDAHEAIRPTNMDYEPDSIKMDLDRDEYLLYQLIWNKFVASQMKPAELDQTTISFEVAGSIFKTSGSVLKFDGFKRLYQEAQKEKQVKKTTTEEEDDDDDSSSKDLPLLAIDELLKQNKEALLQEKWTTPPARFNDGTLIEELEKRGIGRPSTYAAIISNISDRQYVAKNKDNRYFPSELGTKLCNMLVTNFPVQMDITFTSKMENKLDEIEAGDQDYKELLKDFWSQLKQAIDEVQKNLPNIQVDPKEIPQHLKSGIKCLDCHQGEYIIRKGSNGDFLACSRYPDCKSTKNFKKGKKGVEIVEAKKTYHATELCNICQSKMVVKKGLNGKFLSCEKYPTCKGVKPMPMDFTCATCNEGKLVKRKSKAGKEFYGCSKYPACNQVYWNKPVTQECSKCQHEWVEEITYKDKDTKKKKVFVQCPKCKNKEARKNEPLKKDSNKSE